MANPNPTKPESTRTVRETETREAAARQDIWTQPSILPDPNPREGFVHRWVRLSALGQVDPTNMNTRMREGWAPVVATEYPEIQTIPALGVHERFSDSIVIGGLILCKAPVSSMVARDTAHRKLAASQLEAVDNSYFRESDPRMPMLKPDRSTRITFGPKTQE